MKPRRPNGDEIDAEFDLDVSGDQIELTVQSRGGTRGTPAARNVDYAEGLEVLLHRLGDLGAILKEVVLDTREEQRPLSIDPPYSLPLTLSGGVDYRRARLAISRAQGANPTRRIRLVARLPNELLRDRAAISHVLVDGTSTSELSADQDRALDAGVADLALTVVTDGLAVAKAMDEIERRLKPGCETISASVGYQGGSQASEVFWNAAQGYWWLLDRDYAENRYWFCMGTEEPTSTSSLSITCEINPPKTGANRRMAGFVAKDESGQLFLLHSGRIGGGKKGIGASAFLEYLKDAPTEMVSYPDGEPRKGIVIGPVNGSLLSVQIGDFVRSVQDFKRGLPAVESVGAPSLPGRSFSPEFEGVFRRTVTTGEVEARCIHGTVVRALKDRLSAMGLTCANDQQRDLFVSSSDETMTHLFEIKSQATTTDLYTAIGQLMLHGTTAPSHAGLRRVLVLPSSPSGATLNAIRAIGLDVVTFAEDGGAIQFIGLREVLGDTDGG